jgi:hypothetical protein
MPRKSASAVALEPVTPIIRQPRLRPPTECKPEVRVEFLEIVDSLAAEHFRPSDRPLLLRYCEAVVAVRETSDTAEFCALTRIQIALARALRLCPSSRGHHRTTARQKGPSVNPPWEKE